MYVYALNVRHFRGFEDLWVFPKEDVNVIVGPNNSGKTTLLHALALLLEPSLALWRPGAVSRFDFHDADLTHPIELHGWLKPRTRQDPRESGTSQVRYDEPDEVKEAFFDKMSEWQMETSSGGDEGEAGHAVPIRLVPVTVDPMESEMAPHETLLAVRVRAAWNPEREDAEVDASIIDQTGREICPLATPHKEALGFKLLGPGRDPLRELSLDRRSVLSQMVDEEEITVALRRLLTALEKSKDELMSKPSVDLLMRRLGEVVAPELLGALVTNLGTQFTLTFLGGDLWRLRGGASIATTVQSTGGDAIALPLEYQGSGVQRLILLIHLLERLRQAESGAIIALEEPEQSLEPSLARWIFGELCALSSESGTASRATGQIFVTTHSPALVSELKGADCLLLLCRRVVDGEGDRHRTEWFSLPGRCLSRSARKTLDRHRERYANALFARHVLLVEGSSEMGFLPVAFRHLARRAVHENPYHLGMELVDGQDNRRIIDDAVALKAYGRECHVLVDYDGPGEDRHEELVSRFGGQVDYVTSWPCEEPLDFAKGCDLEVVLAAYVRPPALYTAIKRAYEDPGHPLEETKWKEACGQIRDPGLSARLPTVNDSVDLNTIELEALGEERVQRGFLFALLHGPHSCKAAIDMRLIAESLAEQNAFPSVVEDLRRKLLCCLISPEKIDHDNPYLSP